MRQEGKGLRALGAALLLASVTIAAPALSEAQEDASVPVTPAEPAEPAAADSPAGADAGGVEGGSEAGQASDPAGTGTAQGAEQAPAPPAPARSGQAKTAASATVSTGDNFYSPATVTVNVGDTVTWRNTGAAQHSATANDGSFDTGIFGPGASRSQSFNSAGTFSYFCVVHGASQSGTVRVNAVSGGSGGGGSGGGTPTSGGSEAAAVASAGAAGSATSLPATGLAALAMALIGVALTASGVLVGRAAGSVDADGGRRRWRSMRDTS